jgi:branched-chain amino acid transport system substrate-binding protein
VAHLDRRQTLRLLASLGAAGAGAPVLSACNSSPRSGKGGTAARNKGTVKLGLLLPQTGGNKAIGDDATNGFNLYVKLAGGRLGGYVAQVVIADEGDGAASAKAAADRLIKQEKVLALSGVASAVSMIAIKDAVEAAQVPLIGSNASPVSLQGVRYIWRTSFVDDEAGKALGPIVAQKVGDGTCIVIGANYQAGHDEIDGFKSTYRGKLEGSPLYTDYLPKPIEDYRPFLNTIKSSKASAVFCYYAGAAAATFVQQYAQHGINLPLYAPGFLTEGAELLRSLGAAAKGIYTSINYSPELDNPANRRFASEYQKEYKVLPTTYAMAAYDAAAVFDKALDQLDGEVAAQQVNAAIGKIGQVDSPRGTWQFNANRTPLQKWYLRQVTLDGAIITNTLISELATLG